MWIVIDKQTSLVVSVMDVPQPEGAWNPERFDVKEWMGCCVRVGDPDPTADDPDYAAFQQASADLDGLADLADGEVSWLEATIPQIAAMDLEDLRTVLLRLAQENLRQIKAWRYLFRRL